MRHTLDSTLLQSLLACLVPVRCHCLRIAWWGLIQLLRCMQWVEGLPTQAAQVALQPTGCSAVQMCPFYLMCFGMCSLQQSYT
jgi:hypothetical protein